MSRKHPTYNERKGMERGRKGKFEHSMFDLFCATNKTLREQARGARWGREQRKRHKARTDKG